MTPSFQTVLFDFDYTLADSTAGIVECVSYALERMGLPPVAPEAIRLTVGLTLAEVCVRLLGPAQAARAEEFTRLFLERAEEVMVARTVVYPAVGHVVTLLQRRGVALGIVSTKYRQRIVGVLRREGLLGAFDVIVGGDDVVQQKPAPEGLLLAIKRLQIAPTRTLYVGDSLTDAETAQRAGVAFVAVVGAGVTPAESFAGYPVRAVLQSIEELPGWLGF